MLFYQSYHRGIETEIELLQKEIKQSINRTIVELKQI